MHENFSRLWQLYPENEVMQINKLNLKNQKNKKNSLSWSWPIPRQNAIHFSAAFTDNIETALSEQCWDCLENTDRRAINLPMTSVSQVLMFFPVSPAVEDDRTVILILWNTELLWWNVNVRSYSPLLSILDPLFFLNQALEFTWGIVTTLFCNEMPLQLYFLSMNYHIVKDRTTWG